MPGFPGKQKFCFMQNFNIKNGRSEIVMGSTYINNPQQVILKKIMIIKK